MANARQCAFDILWRIQKEQAYSNLTLDATLQAVELDEKESGFCTAMVYGVLERKITLDYQLSLYLSQSLSRLRPEVLLVLEIGAYQILFMDKVPESAAVNESVKLVKKKRCAFAAGLVNAVLRKVAQNGLKLPDKNNNLQSYFSIAYSCPDDLIAFWINAYGCENTERILQASIGDVPTILRVNTIKTTSSELCRELKEDGYDVEVSAILSDALVLKRSGGLERTNAYQQGKFHVQDIASQLCCKAVAAQRNDLILDVCAAPGGKTFTLAQYMQGTGCVESFDLHDHRVKLIAQGAKRLGLENVKACQRDATQAFSRKVNADRILCDVPCSGLGIIRRKPEIRYKPLADIDNLPDLQYLILRTSVSALKPGGRIVYSTCTLNPAENEQVCRRFLQENPDYYTVTELTDIPCIRSEEGFMTFLPHLTGSDGFFVAVMEKRK